MNKDLIDLRKKNLEQLDAELISARESQFGLRIKHKTAECNLKVLVIANSPSL